MFYFMLIKLKQDRQNYFCRISNITYSSECSAFLLVSCCLSIFADDKATNMAGEAACITMNVHFMPCPKDQITTKTILILVTGGWGGMTWYVVGRAGGGGMGGGRWREVRLTMYKVYTESHTHGVSWFPPPLNGGPPYHTSLQYPPTTKIWMILSVSFR